MTYPHRPAGPAGPAEPVTRPWIVRPNGRPMRSMPLTRRYRSMWLNPRGDVEEMTRIAPAMPAFESAFAALARGALVATPGGRTAIEDLLPGDQVHTTHGPQTVRWIGQITLPPANLRQDSGPEVVRFSADGFGIGHPAPDVLLCSAARIVHRAPNLRAGLGVTEALIPVMDFVDGDSVTLLSPMSAVQAFHVMLDNHALLDVCGLTVESYLPSRDIHDALSGDLLSLFLAMFPHLHDMAGFGSQILPRTTLEAIAAFSAAS